MFTNENMKKGLNHGWEIMNESEFLRFWSVICKMKIAKMNSINDFYSKEMLTSNDTLDVGRFR